MYCLIFIATLVGITFGRQVPLLDGRIVGGLPTEIESYPYHLSLSYTNRYRCGATLIRPSVAITAAHCTEDVVGSSYLTVRGGSTTTNKGGQVARVVQVCQHPKFNKDTLDYDVSLLLLNQSLSLGNSVKTISFQPVNAEIPTGTIGTVTGWGRLKHQGPLPEKLQVVQIPKIDDNTCIDIYKKEADVTTRMVCFGYVQGGKDACEGDSGGPLVVNGKLVGIVSWGLGCAAPNKPGVYTKISNPEINAHITDCLSRYTVNTV